MPGQVEQDDGVTRVEEKFRPLNQGQPVGAAPVQKHDRAATALSISHPSDQFGRIGLIENHALDGQVAGRCQSLPGLAGDQHRADMPVEGATGSDEPDQRDREQNAKHHCRSPGSDRRLIRTGTG